MQRIDRIMISGDLLRVKKENGISVNFHEKRINKYYHLLQFQLNEACCVPVEKWNTDNTDFSAEYVYQECGLVYGETEEWLKIYGLYDIPKTILDYYYGYMEHALVIYIEMSLMQKRIHSLLNIPYLDLTVHPVRFLDDHLLGIATNREEIFRRMRRYQADENSFRLHASLIKSMADFNPLPIEENAALIAGQTNIDKALYADGRCLSIMDYEDEIVRLGERYDIVYYKAHPFNTELKAIHAFLGQFPFIRLCPSDWNVYKMLAHENLQKVYAITSGVLYEAPYFGKESEAFYGLPLKFDYDRNCGYEEEIYLSIYNSYLEPGFWKDVLQDIIEVNQGCREIVLAERPNRLRAVMNDYWSYTELDPTVITVGKMYNTRLREVERVTKGSDGNIKYEAGSLTGQVAFLTEQLKVLRSDPCFERNVLKREMKRAVFALSVNSRMCNPLIVLYKLQREALPYQETDSVIHAVRGITYRPHAPHGGRGGGGAVLSAMQAVFQDEAGGYPITYSYSERDGIWHTLRNRYYSTADYNRFINQSSQLTPLYAAIVFAIRKTCHEKGKLYICHEYATAYGLSLMHKKYILVIHTQGTRVDEKRTLGEGLCKSEELVIAWCEKRAMESAVLVCFPSKGAEEMYFSSRHCMVSRKQVHIGPPMYNTLYAFPAPCQVWQAEADAACITFLSVGTLTAAKGQDRVCRAMEALLKVYDGKIRWICVGKGPMGEQIKRSAGQLETKYQNFSFLSIAKVSFAQMQYLYSIADIYMMLHRISVFDLATLEAMQHSCAVVLSPTGGNLEFNCNQNIVYAEEDISDVLALMEKETLQEKKERNRIAYETGFSMECFRARYESLIQETIKEINGQVNRM